MSKCKQARPQSLGDYSQLFLNSVVGTLLYMYTPYNLDMRRLTSPSTTPGGKMLWCLVTRSCNGFFGFQINDLGIFLGRNFPMVVVIVVFILFWKKKLTGTFFELVKSVP